MVHRIIEVNLEQLVENYTWGCYKRNKGCFEKLFLRRSDYFFDIRWEYVDFKHVTNPEEDLQQSNNGKNDTADTATADKDDSCIAEQLKDIVPPSTDEDFKKDVELYNSEYRNATGIGQKYAFTATRDTTSSTKFEIQEGYSLGLKTNLEINIAKIVKLRGGTSETVSVTEKNTEEFKKTLTWNVNTEIAVPPWNIAKASLYVYEIPTKSKFVVKTLVSLPTGRFPVSIRRIKDSKEVHRELITNLSCLLDDDYIKNSSVELVPKRVVTDTGRELLLNDILLTTSGICKSVSFKNQHVNVECEDIKRPAQSITTQTDS